MAVMTTTAADTSAPTATEPRSPSAFASSPDPGPSRISRRRSWDGVVRSGGRFVGDNEEHNPDLSMGQWRGTTSEIGVGRKMEREDPIAAAIVNAYVAPLLNTTWTAIPPDPEDANHRMVAGFIDEVILGDSWMTRLRNSLLCIRDGCRLGEVVARRDHEAVAHAYRKVGRVWEKQDGGKRGLFVPEVYPIEPYSIDEWISGADGSFGGIRQEWRQQDDADYMRTVDEPVIPSDSLVLWTWHGESSHWEGTSILRPCWAAYRMRRKLLKLAGIGFDRWAVGTPVVKQTDRDAPLSADDWTTAKAIAREFRAHELQYLAAPDGMEWDILEADMKTGSVLLEYYDHLGRMMARGAGVEHIFTNDARGSYSADVSQSDRFFLNLQQLGYQVAEVWTHDVVRRVCEWNGWPKEWAPEIACGELQAKNMKEIAETMKAAREAGVWTPTLEDEIWYREQGGYVAVNDDVEKAWEKKSELRENMPTPPAPGGGNDGPRPAGPNVDDQAKAPDTTSKGASAEGSGNGGGGGSQQSVAASAGNVGRVCSCGEPPATALSATPEIVDTVQYAAQFGPMHALAESYFFARESRVGREDRIRRTANGAMEIVQQIAEDYAERMAAAGSMKEAIKIKPRGVERLASYLSRQYRGVERMARDEVVREKEAQKNDPDYAEKFAAAMAEWTADGDDEPFAFETKKPKKGKPSEEKALDEYEDFAARTSAEKIGQQIQAAGNAAVQNQGSGASAASITDSITTQITPRTITSTVQPDVNGVYGKARFVQGKAEDFAFYVYTTSPELGTNGAHDPCSECEATASHPDSAGRMDSLNAWMFETPNPQCESVASGASRCWCTRIFLSQPPEGVA